MKKSLRAKSLRALGLCVFIAAPLSLASNAQAGPATEAFTSCLVRSVTPEDHIVLVKWVFATIALHPALKDMSSLTTDQRTKITNDAGALYTRLLTDSCRAETVAAYQEAGSNAMYSAFSVLGATAMRDLMGNADVQTGLGQLGASMDQVKLKAVIDSASVPDAAGKGK